MLAACTRMGRSGVPYIQGCGRALSMQHGKHYEHCAAAVQALAGRLASDSEERASYQPCTLGNSPASIQERDAKWSLPSELCVPL